MINWEALGAIGEMGGTLVVVVTLIYLARQLSQTQTSIRQQYHDNVNVLFNNSFGAVAATPELAEAIAKVEAGDELNSVEHVQVRHHLATQLNGYEILFLHAKEFPDLLGEPEIRRMVAHLLALPLYKQMWNELKPELHPRFVKFVDLALAK